LELGARSSEDVEAENRETVEHRLLSIGAFLQARGDLHEFESVRGLDREPQQF